MRKLLLTTVAAAAIFGAWQVTPAAFTRFGLCTVVPDQCLEWRRSSLESTRATLIEHRARIQDGVRTLEAHAAQLRQRLDAIKANSQLLAQREQDRRQRNAATLDFAGRSYGPADVEAQARLWAAEQAQFEAVLTNDIAARRAQFAEARERVSLAYSRVDSVVEMMTADLALAPVMRDLDRIRRLSVAADTATREAGELLDPVRSVLELPPLTAAGETPRSAERPAFDLDGWLRQNSPAQP